jgi:hypothetical protein
MSLLPWYKFNLKKLLFSAFSRTFSIFYHFDFNANKKPRNIFFQGFVIINTKIFLLVVSKLVRFYWAYPEGLLVFIAVAR